MIIPMAIPCRSEPMISSVADGSIAVFHRINLALRKPQLISAGTEIGKISIGWEAPIEINSDKPRWDLLGPKIHVFPHIGRGLSRSAIF